MAYIDYEYYKNLVAPFVGVWIEITEAGDLWSKDQVAPFVGVWIEISMSASSLTMIVSSLPSWECGLK